MQNQDPLLAQKLTPLNAWAFSFACAIGWAAFVMPATYFLPVGGITGSVWGFVIGGAMMCVIAMNYHYLGNLYPTKGGIYNLVKASLSRKQAFAASWAMGLAHLCCIPLNAKAMGMLLRTILEELFGIDFEVYFFGSNTLLVEAVIVVAALVLKTCGTVGAAGMVASIAIGSVVCIVAAIAGDTAQDLKTGNLLGATPWKQQVGELVGVTASALAIGGVLVLLHKAWGFGSDAISAPQAMLMKGIVEGIMEGGLPWNLIGIGAAIAAALALLRVPVMPVAIGMYLPVGLSVTMFAGGLLRWAVSRRQSEDASKAEDVGTLFSAGLVAGEGLCGIILAVLALV